MTKSELLTKCSSKELTEWIALWAIRAEEAEEQARRRGR